MRIRTMFCFFFFFFNDTATTEIYTLSLHDALPISMDMMRTVVSALAIHDPDVHDSTREANLRKGIRLTAQLPDRKSTRLNSSHSQISYAVFCLKKKKKHQKSTALLQLLRM